MNVGYGIAGTFINPTDMLPYYAQVSTIIATATIASANSNVIVQQKGRVTVNAGGTFIPQYSLTAAPGGAYSTVTGSSFKITPISTLVGTWV